MMSEDSNADVMRFCWNFRHLTFRILVSAGVQSVLAVILGALSPHPKIPLPAVEARGSVPSCARLSRKRSRLTRDVEEPSNKALAVAHGRDVATQPGVKAETAPGALESEQEH
jgi:hypothetical protein